MTSFKKRIFRTLDQLKVELPSWGFANTGTRFGKFIQPAAATDIYEKLQDAAQVHTFTGCCPRVAVHTAWDFPAGLQSAEAISDYAKDLGIRLGSVNPTLFEDQEYKFGSLGNPDTAIRGKAMNHIKDSLQIARRVGSKELVLWFADGSNYPGTANIRQRKAWFEEALIELGSLLSKQETMLIEYKPFEPAFYHSDIADWGMAFTLAQKVGTRARVLVDTGHHYQAQNIEQIVAWLLSERMLGGFHFNDRRYADDDLTVGSIDPYQLFRIFHEIFLFCWETSQDPPVSYMVDQSHNLKPKIEAMIQTVETVQEIAAKASVVEYELLAKYQNENALIDAEDCLREAFGKDVAPYIRQWRESRGLPVDPLSAFRESGYTEQITRERKEKNREATSSYVKS